MRVNLIVFTLTLLLICLSQLKCSENVKFLNSNHIKSKSNNGNLSLMEVQLNTSLNTFLRYLNEYGHIDISDEHIRKIKSKSNNAERNESAEVDKIYAYYNEHTHKIEFTETESPAKPSFATGHYQRTRYTTGWDKLHIKTNTIVNPLIQCWTAGFIEGLLSSAEIYDYYHNIHVFFHKNEELIDEIKNFYAKVDKSISDMITVDKFEHLRKFSFDSAKKFKKWSYITCFHAQLKGLHAGYNKIADKKLDLLDFYFINSEGNFGDLKTFMDINHLNFDKASRFYTRENLMKVYNTDNLNQIWKNLYRQGHCSAIVKLIKNQDGTIKDMIGGHNTWSSYCEMMRTMKYVEFGFEGIDVPFTGMKSRTISFSSYPAVLFSGDDFYEIDSKLVILQTTLSAIDKFIYKDILNVSDYIPEFMRIMLTNHISETGEEWVSNYQSYKNHMYITQWLVLDYKELNTLQLQYPNSNPKGLVMLVEEVPGSIQYKDMTEVLLRDGFLGSFNLAYFKIHQKILGLRFNNYDFTSKSYNPRYYLLQELQKDITNIVSFSKLLMYNRYNGENDPDDELVAGMSPRGDLGSNPSYYGGIDFKIVSKDLVNKMSVYTYGGPSYQFNQYLQPFNFSQLENTYRSEYHRGIPEKFNFQPFIFALDNFLIEVKKDYFIQ